MDSESPTGTPAPYGRACSNCSKAKCRCIYRVEGASCERCHRLSKVCQPSTTVRKNRSKKSTRTRTPALEEKLDNIVTLLRSQVVAPPPVTPQAPPTAPTTASTSSASETSNLVPALCLNPPSSTSSVPYVTPPGISAATDHINSVESEDCLKTFRDLMLPLLPFTYIPLDVSAVDLKRDRPFLWLSIASITNRSRAKQAALSTVLQNIVAQKLVLGTERSLDLLLGIICFLAWSHFHRTERPYLTVWVSLASALTADLGLNKPGNCTTTAYSNKLTWGTYYRDGFTKSRTREEQRAVLSVFLISSMISRALHRPDTLRFTPHMEQCLQALIEKPEYDGDTVLVIQVRCHLIVEHMIASPWQINGIGEGNPPPYYTKALQAQLQEIKRTVPTELENRHVVCLCLASLEVSIHEVTINVQTNKVTGGVDMQKLEAMHACQRAVEEWLRVFFDLPLLSYVGISLLGFFQLSHCALALLRLSTVNFPGWDREAVMKSTNVLEVIQNFSERLFKIPELFGFIHDLPGDDIFTKSGVTMRAKLDAWAAEINASRTVDGERPATQPAESQAQDDLLMSMNFSFGEETWMTDLLVPWDS